MRHLGADALVELALGNGSCATPRSLRRHLRRCAECRSGLEQLRAAVRAVRSANPADLPNPPPERVWRAIRAELRADRPPPPP